jgi:transposase
MPNPKPPYPVQFREQMVELVRAGRWPSELVKEFGCHATSPLSWVRMACVAHGTTPNQSASLCADERHDLIELRRKLRQVQVERDILAKATAWFASNGNKTSTPSMR